MAGPKPGRYNIIIHYYQPNNPAFEAQASVDNAGSISGIAKFDYCPHTSGCRTLLKDGSGTNLYTIGKGPLNIRMQVPRKKDVWIVSVIEHIFTVALVRYHFCLFYSRIFYYYYPSSDSHPQEGRFRQSAAAVLVF